MVYCGNNGECAAGVFTSSTIIIMLFEPATYTILHYYYKCLGTYPGCITYNFLLCSFCVVPSQWNTKMWAVLSWCTQI